MAAAVVAELMDSLRLGQVAASIIPLFNRVLSTNVNTAALKPRHDSYRLPVRRRFD